MAEQQPDKRCGTCEHFKRCQVEGETWCSLELPRWLDMTIVMEINRVALADESCSFWTPKPPKNPEEK